MLAMPRIKQNVDFYQILRKSLLKVIFLINIKLNVTNAALRTVDFKGGLINF